MNREQQLVARFTNGAGLNGPVNARVLDLVSEVGELAKEYLRATDYGKHEFQSPRGWEEEIGDVFYSLASIANSTGVDLSRALEKVIRKYEERLIRTGAPSSSR
ncbi:MAG: nucleotide pyrophosphohydrolase [Deltaproteobacteria bacterium]|nr:nucleotide pyrophosphohydrolase [Deltaproteobacteria bacterium]